jgi:opacity protein-like surface antigen
MKKYILLLVAALIVLPTLGFSDTFSVKVGYFFPSAGTEGLQDLWKTEFDNMSFLKSDFQSTIFGVSYERFINPYMSFVLAVDTYSKTRSGYYKDWVGGTDPDLGDFAFPSNQFNGAFSLIQTFSVSILPVQLSVKITPTGRRGSFIPYFGGGVGMYLWNVRMLGDMVDFSDKSFVYSIEGQKVLERTPQVGDVQVYPVAIVDTREQNRISFGYQAFAGVMVPVGQRMTVEGEFKYNYAKGKMENFLDFPDFDLRGFQLSVGLNYWF